jgi:hypothetical protein
MDADELRKLVNASLLKSGFKRKASSWYKKTDDVVLVFNLQRSSYDPVFYVNLACAPLDMEIEGMPTPKEHHCPIRIRLDAASPEDKADIRKTFDLETDVSDEERFSFVRRLISDRALAFMEHLGHRDTLRDAIATGLLRGGLVTIAAKRHLGLEAAPA